MTIRQRGSGWQVDIMLAGTRYRPTFPSQEAAEDWQDAARKAHSRGAQIPPLQEEVKQRVNSLATVEQAIDYTVKAQWIVEEAKTVDKQEMNARAFLEFIGNGYPVSAVNPADIDQYATWLVTEKNNSGATVNRKLSAIRQVFKKAVVQGWMSHVPLFPKRRKEGDPRMRWLTKEEEQHICQMFEHWAVPQYSELFQFLIDTGLRISEATGLEWEDVAGDKVILGVNKSTKNNDRWVGQPLTNRAQQILARRRGLERPWPINQDHLRRTLAKVCDHLGYKDVVIHTTRHTTASRLVQAGVDIARVQKFMRHKSIQMTMKYAKLRTDDLDVAVEALEG